MIMNIVIRRKGKICRAEKDRKYVRILMARKREEEKPIYQQYGLSLFIQVNPYKIEVGYTQEKLTQWHGLKAKGMSSFVCI